MGNVESDAIELLSSLGLTVQEGKAYIALLRSGPVTPYRIAKDSGIPTGKIYDVVQRLSLRGLVTEVSGSDGGLVAKDPDSALREMADRYQSTVQAAAARLRDLRPAQSHNVAWSVEGEEEVVLCGKRIMDRAVHRLTIAAPPDLLERWIEGLGNPVKAKVEVQLLSSERPPSAPENWKWRRLTPANSIKVLKNGAVITADRNVVFFVSANAATGNYEGSWTETPAIVAMADDYIASLIFIEDVFDNQWIPWGEI